MIKELEISNFEEDKCIKKLNKIKEVLDKKIDIDNSFNDLFDLLINKVYVSKINNDRKHIELNILFNFDNSSKKVVYKGDKNFNLESPYIDSNGCKSLLGETFIFKLDPKHNPRNIIYEVSLNYVINV